MRRAAPRRKDVLDSIAANVKRLRERRKLTQETLAERAELDVRFVQRIERARINLSVSVLILLAEALEVPPSRLLKKAALPKPVVGRPKKRRAGKQK